MLRMIAEGDEIVVGLVREKPDQSRRELDYDLVTRIVFDKTSGAITSDVQHDVVEQIRELYRHHSAHTSEDVRSMMTSFLTEAGVTLRDSGGVYFVPSTHSSQLDALCRVVQEIGPHNKTFVLPIVDTPAAQATLREVTQSSLDDEVRALEEELKAFDPEKVRSSTLERRLVAFEDLKARVGLFANVLSFKADGLHSRLTAINTEVRRSLGLEAPLHIDTDTKDDLDVVSVPIPPPRRVPIAPVSSEIGF
ncbi:MAG: hypothetical protein HYV07_14080 [Deltaproteobacteria bacterium]|nr:hypothetical protein [Deltaproteobacteria bacterium]